MKLQDQVCALEQSKRLFELGLKEHSLFIHLISKDGSGEHIGLWDFYKGDRRTQYAAYTVAELGTMMTNFNLPIYWKLWGEWCYKEKDQPRGYPTEAQARAAMLIHLIENKLISSEQINKTLQP